MSAKQTKPHYPIHKNGKRCGYEEYEDGSIMIAPTYSDRIDNALDGRATVDTLLKMVTEQCFKLLEPITKSINEFWEDVKEDYGLDYEKYDYSYRREIRSIVRKEKQNDSGKPQL